MDDILSAPTKLYEVEDAITLDNSSIKSSLSSSSDIVCEPSKASTPIHSSDIVFDPPKASTPIKDSMTMDSEGETFLIEALDSFEKQHENCMDSKDDKFLYEAAEEVEAGSEYFSKDITATDLSLLNALLSYELASKNPEPEPEKNK